MTLPRSATARMTASLGCLSVGVKARAFACDAQTREKPSFSPYHTPSSARCEISQIKPRSTICPSNSKPRDVKPPGLNAVLPPPTHAP